MAEESAHAEPAGTTAQTAPTPAAGTPAASSLQADQSFSSKIEKASTPAELTGLLSSLMKRVPAAPEKQAEPAQASAESAAGETPAETPSEESAPPAEGEETPPAESAEEETPPGETAETEELSETDRDQPVTPSTANKIGLRLPKNDELGRLATAYMRRNADWTLEQAMEAAKAQLGGNKPSATAAETTAPTKPADPDLPGTIEEVDAKAAQLEEALEKAAEELDTLKEAKIHRQLRKLDRHREELKSQAVQQQATGVEHYNREFTASESRAVELFPFAADPNSDGGKLMVEIEKALEETQDPRFFHPNKPLLIAQMAAAELGIAPRRKGAPAAQAKPAVTTPPAPTNKKGVLPSGSSRTVPVSTNPNGEFVKSVGSVKTALDLRKMTEGLGIRLSGV
jgi:hypothetical protein